MLVFHGRIEKLLASLGSASTQKCFAFLVAPAEQFAMRKSGRIATFPEGGNLLVALLSYFKMAHKRALHDFSMPPFSPVMKHTDAFCNNIVEKIAGILREVCR